VQKSESTSSRVVLSTPDPNWIKKFLNEKRRIQSIQKLDLAVEHIGSTSIPNLDAKPIIDMLVGNSTAAELDPALRALVSLGYTLEGRRNDNQHSWLSYPSPEKRRFIIHLVVKDDDEWIRRIGFRNFLRSHPETAAEYKELKLELAKKYPDDLSMYTHGKARFVTNVLTTASITVGK